MMGNQEGFVIMSNDDLLPEVLAVGDKPFSGQPNDNFRWWLDCIEAIGKEYVAQGVALTASAYEDDDFPDEVEPLVHSHWGQGTPYNNYCPTRYGQRSVTGCVATALAQVLYTHRYPATGVGSVTRKYFGQSYTANYGETTYDFNNMLEDYRNGYNDVQADAVATLMLHCGLAVNMDYSPEGSGSYSDVAAEGMRKYFGISTAECHNRSDYSTAEWKRLIYTELAGGHAMYYSGIDAISRNGGHAFVCDGYDAKGLLHINWGWEEQDDGYFNMDLLNPSGYKFSIEQDIITGLYDPDYTATGSPLISLDIENEKGKLLENIGVDNLALLKGVTISGELDQSDLNLLKSLSSGDYLAKYGTAEDKGVLRVIDLTHAVLDEDVLPAETFRDCNQLRNIKLPKDLKKIGDYAFAGCSRLSTITSYTYNVPKMGKRCFEGVSADMVTLKVIAGSSDLYRRNSQWKGICTTSNVLEFGTCIKVKNVARQYGEANPVLGYQMIGQRVVGAPNIYTDATSESLPGTYTIFVEPGSITATDNVIYVPGTLTIEGDVTAIENLSDSQSAATTVYTLDGKKVAPSAKSQIHVKDGKSIIVR